MNSQMSNLDDAPAIAARDADARRTAGSADGELVGRSVTINRPRADVYAFWRDFSNLPLVMENIERVDMIDDRRSHWVVKGPGGATVEWDSEVTQDDTGERIAWRSLDGADVTHSGEVEFLDAAPDRGTIVRAKIMYQPPGGKVAQWLAKLLQREPAVQVRRDLRRLKQLLETGEVTNSAGPSGRKGERPDEQAL